MDKELCYKFQNELVGLTPGGSEYVNDPKLCADYVKEKRRKDRERIISLMKRLKEKE